MKKELLKHEELIVDEIYRQGNFVFEYCNHENNGMGRIGYGNYLNVVSRNFVKHNNSVYNPNGNPVSLPSQEEKNWLNACIEAKKFIPFDEVNQSINYEIY